LRWIKGRAPGRPIDKARQTVHNPRVHRIALLARRRAALARIDGDAMPAAMFLTPDDAEQAFYEALRSGNADAVMEIWSEDEEIVCVHPSGPRNVGPAPVRASFEQILEKGGLQITANHIQVARNPLCAVHNVLEQILVESKPALRFAFVLATNVYLKEADGWRLVLHHASPAIGHDDMTESGTRSHRLH
jgi:ketosteroid isomerase-like protein